MHTGVTPLVEVEDVSVHFGSSRAVDGVSLQVLAGEVLAETSSIGSFLTLLLLSSCAALLLPRQFHMAVVENRAIEDVRRASWLFPLYLVLINLFVIPIALGGVATFGTHGIDRDMTVLALPLRGGAERIALVAFLGGLSAATAMVIVESVAVAIMISNHLVMPIVLRRRAYLASRHGTPAADLSGFVLGIRRIAIVVVLLLAYAYYRVSGQAALAAIGLLSFAAIAQIAPAFLGGLIWSRGTARGASAGLIVGFLTWAYTLLLPSLVSGDGAWSGLVASGPFGMEALRPTVLFGADLPQLSHGVVWSLALNLLAYLGFSLMRPATGLARKATGPQGPINRATSAGRMKIAAPITWLTPMAVRSHRPSARRSSATVRHRHRGHPLGVELGPAMTEEHAGIVYAGRRLRRSGGADAGREG